VESDLSALCNKRLVCTVYILHVNLFSRHEPLWRSDSLVIDSHAQKHRTTKTAAQRIGALHVHCNIIGIIFRPRYTSYSVQKNTLSDRVGGLRKFPNASPTIPKWPDNSPTPTLPCNGRKWSGAGQKLAVFCMLGCARLLCSVGCYAMRMKWQVCWLFELFIVCGIQDFNLA
jgi:hypothetical protein